MHRFSIVFTAVLIGGCGDGAASVGQGDVTGSDESALTYSMNLSPGTLSLAAGASTTLTAKMSATGSSSVQWALSASGLPSGVTASFSPATVQTGAASTVTLSASASAAAGAYTFRITGTSPTMSHYSSGHLTITAGNALQNGVPVTVSGAQGSQQFFTVALPSGSSNLNVSVSGGSGDADVYLRFGAAPTGSTYDCRTKASGNNDVCTVAAPQSGTWYVMVDGYQAFSNASLVATFATSGGTGGGAGGGGGGGGGGTGGSGGGGGGSGGGTGVGPTGGSVNLLHFGLSGDTRPPSCGDTPGYPTAVINTIADDLKARGAQFVADLGDHMYVCNGDINVARTQMGLYQSAMQRFGGTWFMAMGNHECSSTPCHLTSTNANYLAFMSALSPVSSKPYYSVNIETSLGRATLVFVADNAWDSAQQTWLEQTLTDADAHAKYTLVLRHHPEDDTSVSTNATSMQIIRAHKFALLLTGHSHLYKHSTVDSGRDLVLGIGGATLAASATYNGYAMVDQLANGDLRVSVYNISGNLQVDSWTVHPNN